MKNILAVVLVAIFILSSDVIATDKINTFSKFHKVFQCKYETRSRNVAFSPDGKYFMAQGSHVPLHLWFVKDYSLYREYKLIYLDLEHITNHDLGRNAPSRIVGANFTPDSKSVYVGFDNGSAMMIALDSGKKTTYRFTDPSDRTSFSVISRSGKILAMGKSYINTVSNKLVSHGIISQSGLVITQDDKYLVTSSYHLSTVDITDISTGKWTRWDPTSFFIDQKVSSIDVSPDNDTIAASLRNGDIRLYSIRESREKGNLSQGGYNAVAFFSSNGKMLLSASDNKKVKLWDVEGRDRLRTWKMSDKVSMIRWIRGTPWVAIGTVGGELIIESTEKEETIFKGKVMENAVLDLDYLPSEHLFLLCDYSGNIAAFKTE